MGHTVMWFAFAKMFMMRPIQDNVAGCQKETAFQGIEVADGIEGGVAASEAPQVGREQVPTSQGLSRYFAMNE